jgi:hypothetical protein
VATPSSRHKALILRFSPASRSAFTAVTAQASKDVSATDYTLATILGVLCSIAAVLVAVIYFWFARKRADVSRSVDDVLGALHRTIADTNGGKLKDLSELDAQIKQFMSDSDACVRVCREILKIVSEHIATLGPRPQVSRKRSIR